MTKTIKRSAAFLSAVAMVMAILLYFPGGMFSTYFGLKASAEGITLTEPQKDGNGVYQIGTAEELYWFADKINNDNENYKSINVVLTKDIVVNENVLDEEGNLAGNTSGFTSWTPIGWSCWDDLMHQDVLYSYSGTFDGQGHTVSGLFFNNTSAQNVGLFGYIGENSSISNVGVVDSYLNGFSSVGGVCGYNLSGTITNCYNTGEVSGISSVGGACGQNSGTIKNCYNTGKVIGSKKYIGGICGDNYGEIKNCYNIGNVSSNDIFVGGVCGVNESGGTISNCYNTGVTPTGNYYGGVCGYNDSGTITKCYYLNTTSTGGINNADVNGSAESKTADDFSAGTVCEAVGYHFLQNDITCHHCGKYDEAKTVSAEHHSELLTSHSGYYAIENASQLYWFAALVNGDTTHADFEAQNTAANAVLTADITVNTGDVAGCNGTRAEGWIDWTPINSYTGTFDGQGHTISGLYFNESSTNIVGLFGVNNGTVQTVGVINSYFMGQNNVGGVCGVNKGTIKNCHNTSTAAGTAQVGGICGINNTACIITNCYNTGNVSSGHGVCGYVLGIIRNCYYNSDVTSYGTGGAAPNVECDVYAKKTSEFNRGEVAYLLSQGCKVGETTYDGSVWGQDLSVDDSYPVLGGKKVLANSDNTKFANDVMIYGQNAAFDGTIDFNIFVAADDNYEWSAKIDGAEVTKPEKDEKGLYKFTCKVAAKNIEFYINENVNATVSVKTYLDALDTADDTKLANLVTAMETYGTAADAFFSNGTVEEVTGVTSEAFSGYAFTKAAEQDVPVGISYYGSSLILKSETTVRHYFQLADGQDITNFKFYVNGIEVTPVAKQGYYYIDIENISADKLGTAHTVKINETTVISNYSALSYAKTVLDKSADNNLQNLVKTLYLYNKKALAYNQTEGGN